MSKKIGQGDIIGQQGINLIERIVLRMGFLWYATGGVEAGTDGFIEIRDPVTEEVTNLIIQVQSKARQKNRFQAETEASFEWRCEPKDINYWLQGNAPVILVVSRIDTDEAYWVSVKDYFSSLARRQSHKVLFDKKKDRFDETCTEALIKLAVPGNSGVYLAPRPKKERIYSNLLRVSKFSDYLYVADTMQQDSSIVYSALLKLGRSFGEEWILKDNLLLSFHNLREPPWNEVCDIATVERFDIEEWADSNNMDKQREFVWLLNKSLREKVKSDLAYSKEKKCYYFKPNKDLSTRSFSYQSIVKKTHRDVFQSYFQKNSQEVAYYRHSAFEGQFQRIDSLWYLEITPTYYFTIDGYVLDKYYMDKLNGIKRQEKNAAVLGQVFMWAEYLKTKAQMHLINPKYQFLEFDELQEFDIDVGIDDNLWLKSEDYDNAKLIECSLDDLPLFKQ